MAKFRILTVDGNEAAEKLLNDTVSPTTRLVQTHIQTVSEERSGEGQENTMLAVPTTRFTFIFSTDAV